MDQIISLVRQFIDLFRVWIIVCPWEQAVRVRFGKRVRVLGPGIHLRLPLLDHIFLQSTRMRICCTDRQTVTALDGKTFSITAAVGYSISDVHALYNTLHHAEDTIRQLVRAKTAEVISRSNSTDLTIERVTREVSASIDLGQYGITGSELYVNEFALSKTYRLIGDYAASYQQGTALSTEAQNTTPKH